MEKKDQKTSSEIKNMMRNEPKESKNNEETPPVKQKLQHALKLDMNLIENVYEKFQTSFDTSSDSKTDCSTFYTPVNPRTCERKLTMDRFRDSTKSNQLFKHSI